MLNSQFCYRQMTNYRENMFIHTVKHAIVVISRPRFIAFMPTQGYGFEGFFRRPGYLFSETLTLLCRVNLLHQ